MSNQASSRKPLIVGIVAAVVVLAALLAVLLTQCAQGGKPTATETTSAKPVAENADLYWNVDRALYDGMSEGGMSSRRPESDGYYHVRFFKDGQILELKVADRNVINNIEIRDLMGLVFDDDGIVVDVIPIEEMPVEKLGWKFYVQSTGGTIIKVNSSNKFDGMEVLLDIKNGAKVYDMTGTLGEIGCESEALVNDRIMAVADLEGNLLAVYIYDRSNMIVEFQAYCQHCDKEVTWQEWDNQKQLPKAEGHFKLMTDIQLSGQQNLQSDAVICLDLNGHKVDGADGARVYSVHSLNSELAIMDTSEEQNGRLAAHGEIYAQGCVVWVRSGNVYMYAGALDASDAVCTGRGGAAVYVAKDRFFYMYGGEIVGGTAKYYFNEDNGSYVNGLGGSVYNIGKFTMKDGVIRDGVAQSVAVWSNGKASYKRGLGGNIYVGSGGEFIMDGGVIKNGRAGSSGNIYMDGTAEFTMNGGSISGGFALDPNREGGNLNMGAKATFTMNGGSIYGGTSMTNVGNVYCAGTFVMQGGTISGGRAWDTKAGAEKADAPGANLHLANGAKLNMYGGTIQGKVSAVDSSTKDNKHTTIVLAGLPKIYSDKEGVSNLTLQQGAEPVRVQVYDLHNLAKVGITATGKFTLETKEANRDNFISDIEGAEILYVDKCLAIGKMACLCGSKTEKHIGNCDGTELLWGPWTSKNSLPAKEGNYFLVNDVSLTGSKAIGNSNDNEFTVSLDLNGKTVQSAQRVATLYAEVNLADHAGGGRIVGAGLKSGDNHTGAVLLTAGSKLNIYGGTIALADDHYDLTTGGAVGIGKGAVVNLYDGVIDGRSADTENKIENGGAVRLSGTLNVLGGTVYGGAANRAGAIYVEKTGLLNVAGGSISGGTSRENGGAIYVVGGKVTMSGGTITGGSGVEGGNIRIQGNGRFDMTGGVIENGTSSKAGGNVYVYTGEFNLSGGEVKNGTGVNGGNFAVASTLNITGGTISGGKTTGKGFGGNIHMSDKKAVVALSAGTVTGGYAGNRGGNLSGIGTLNMTGGSITKGDSANGGGNIDAAIGSSVTLNISGGSVTGGLYKGNADTDRGNIYMTTGTLNISGNAVIDGGMLLVNTAKCSISGNPQIVGKEFGIRLAGVDMDPPVLSVGDLGENAKIGLNHEGVFGVEGEAKDTARFIPADESFTVHHDPSDNTLYVGRVHCLCENGEADWCDHKLVRWTKWDGKSSIYEGNYYLAADATIGKNLTIGQKGMTLNICLNGKTITGKNTRIMNVYGNVSIVDHGEGKGTLVSTGAPVQETEKDGVITTTVEHSAVAVVLADATLNLYGGSLKLAADHNQLSDMGGVVSVAAGGTMNIYGGSVDASASLTSEQTLGAGGAIRVDGKLNVLGGNVVGGEVVGNGGAILLRSASAEVNISGGSVAGGKAARGGAVYVAAGKLTVSKDAKISGGNASGGGGAIYTKAGEVTVSGGSVENGDAGSGKGGNILVVGGSLTVSGGEVKGGKASQGGNIAVQQVEGCTVNGLTISGGAISGGTAGNANNRNIYVNNQFMTLSGGSIDGGVSIINTSGTNAGVLLSGAPVVKNANGVTNLRLAKTGGELPVVTIVGELTGEANSIGITAPDGVVVKPGANYAITETDKACFFADDGIRRLRYAGTDLELYVPHLHCWCKNAVDAPAHTCVDDQEWTPITGTKTMTDGFYYFDWTGSKAASITVSAGKHAHLCLNGAQIYAKKTVTLEAGSTLTICDCGTTGRIGVSASAERAPIQLSAESTVNLYSGSITGCLNGKEFAAVTVNNESAVFNMYGGKLYCDQSKPLSGANLVLTSGTANIFGGTIEPGTAADSYGIRVDGGALNLGGNVNITSISLAAGKTIALASPLTGSVIKVDAAEGLFATGAIESDAGKFEPVNPKFRIVFAEGQLKFEKDPSGMMPKTLKYDDRKDIVSWLGLNGAPASVQITNQQVTSTQVGTDTADANVLEYQDGVIYAVGVGTAVLTVDDEDYLVTVEPAKLSLFMITGHSLAVGQYGDANKSLVVEAGQAYSTYAANMDRMDDADVQALIDPNGGLGFGAADRAGATLDAFAPGQGGTTGEGSAIASSWIDKTSEKVWILNAARGGSSINSWVPGTTDTGYDNIGSHDLAVALFLEAQQVLQREIAAGHYTLGDMAVIYHNGGNFSESNGLKDQYGQLTFTWAQLKSWYDAMWNSYQTNFNKDLDGDGNVDTVKLAISNGGHGQNYDMPLGYYLGVTDPDMATVLENYADWKEDLSTFPAPDYEVQDGSVLKAPESLKHIDRGGTSANSFYCSRDDVHLSQVVYNAMGLDVAANLYGALRADRTLTDVKVYDAKWKQATNATLRVGQSWIYALVGAPYYGTGATVEATGAIALDTSNPWIVYATEVGDGKLTVKMGSEVLAEVEFTIVDGHKHCTCVGAEATIPNHSCDSTTSWTSVGKVGSSKTVMSDGGHYFLDWSGSSAQSLVVAESAEVYLCLNGATIRAAQAITLNNKSVLHICDCSQEETGMITVSGLSENPVIMMSGLTNTTVNLYSGIISGTYSTKSVQTVRLHNGTPTFNMYGGTITGGRVPESANGDKTYGGNVRISGVNAKFNMYGGTISGGQTAYSGGNLHISKGQFNMTGGVISNGTAAGKGGNICIVSVGTLVMNLNGGEITGGTAAAGAGIYMEAGTLNVGGNTAISAAVDVVSTKEAGCAVNIFGTPNFSDHMSLSATESNPVPVIQITGALTNGTKAASIPVSLPDVKTGIVAQSTTGYTMTAADMACFRAYESGYGTRANGNDVEIYKAHTHCWCENADAVPAGHTCNKNQIWQAVTAGDTLNSGYYHLGWTGEKAAGLKIGVDQTVYLCLNGASVRAQKGIELLDGATLYICDCSEGHAGVVTTTRDNPLVVTAGKNVYLMSGKVVGTYRTAVSRVSVLVDGGNFYMYGGKLMNGCAVADATLVETADGIGGNLYVKSGAASILGGVISGGKLGDANRDVTFAGGSLTLGGKVSIGAVSVAEGKTITLKDDFTTTAPIPVTMNTAGVFAVAEAGKALTYEGKSRFASSDAKLNVAFTGSGYALTDGPVGCLCGKTDGTHEDYCTKLDPVAWTGAGLPTATGNYYLTAPVEVEASTTVAADTRIKLWLQGNDITVKIGSSVKNIFEVAQGGVLELCDTTGEGVVDGLVKDATDNSKTGAVTERIINSNGTVILNGAKLDASGLTIAQDGLAIRGQNGTVLIKNGTITGGTANGKYGGAIYVTSNASMHMLGGTITGGTAKFGGNIGARGPVYITGGSITGGTYTSGGRGGNILVDGSGSYKGYLELSNATVSGGLLSGSTELKDRGNVAVWGASVKLKDVTIPGGILVLNAENDSVLTLSGLIKIDVTDSVNGLMLGALNENKTPAKIRIEGTLDAASVVDINVHINVRTNGVVMAEGLTEAQATGTIFTCVNASSDGVSLTPVKQADETWQLIVKK